MSQPATSATAAHNARERALQPLADTRAFDDAQRGFIAPLHVPEITNADGRVVWTLKGYEFLEPEDAPDTVHPGLWRHARVNMAHGLYRVTERLYQLRGLDISNMTVIEGDTGLIVIDPLISTEAAAAGMALYFEHRPRKPVVAVIYTHSHVDHFGGVRGVIDEADVTAGHISVWAPAGFMEAAIGENVMAGNAMSRRAQYQFGHLLPRGERGQVDAGLGKGVSTGTVSLIPPTHIIDDAVETHTIDGIRIVFELTPETEAPSEMIMHYPDLRVLNMAEISSQNFHNLLPIRGALVRDALAWSKYLGSALQRYGSASDILIAQHHWPVWGSEAVQEFLDKQRAAYKYLHDQALRLLNHGYTAAEAAEYITLPQSLSNEWHTHCFYGCLRHNVKAIFQRYIGYYDGNPANLEALPPVPSARKAVDYMGGAAAVLQRARADYDKGEYRWVAHIASQLVFADPSDAQARALGADALEQLGYQSESATARNAYLQGASELRHGVSAASGLRTVSPDLVKAMSLEQYFDYLAIRINGPKAVGKSLTVNWQFTDTAEQLVLRLNDSTLTTHLHTQSAQAQATVVLARATLDRISLQLLTFPEAVQSGLIQVQGGSPAVLLELLGLLDKFPSTFPLVEPRTPLHALTAPA
jgi:alkyl sulfatase BDS1-like metallo-beta-lactamase superfamily hydrolase